MEPIIQIAELLLQRALHVPENAASGRWMCGSDHEDDHRRGDPPATEPMNVKQIHETSGFEQPAPKACHAARE
ncbi:MAG TPA: hypothetical protein VJU87_10460 [Gemmatimonadaceae bacterium]|nr:hypothetical protein [Gemmatimonadaceae bacterium]